MEAASHSRLRSDTLADKLETPLLDNRQYKVIRLPNKLEALLIHDPDTDKASAALDVNVGALCDDRNMPGMAHAVEHLLFMGTEKYPVENEYARYLAAHSGYSNASTGSTSTNYYFEVAAQADAESDSNGADATQTSPLHGAMDRFAQFFVKPLFLEDTLDRELRAVESENKKNLQSDVWRMQQLHKSLGNPAHPFTGFSTGNLQTLRDEPQARGVKIRDEFIKFYEKHYSANRMKLVVLGREPVSTLQEWVESMFSDVKNQDLPQNRWDGLAPYLEDQLSTLIYTKPVMNNNKLDFRFVYRDETEMYDTQPARYLSHLVGHEGPGSILAYIKAKGWAYSLSSGSMSVCPGASVFTTSVGLTPLGLEHYKEVAKALFYYISVLREREPQEWIFDEVKDMSAVNFKFTEKSSASNTTSFLSGVMQKPQPRDQILSAYEVLRRFDSKSIQEAIDLVNPDNVRITLITQEPVWKGEFQREKWYGTEYATMKIPEDFKKELVEAYISTPSQRPKELHLPDRNEFIPSRLDVDKKTTKEPLKAPKLIRNDDAARIWYKKDDRFWVPQASLQIIMRNPLCYSSPRTIVLVQFIVDLVSDALGEYAYNAEIAGLDYALYASRAGLNLDIKGYNDKVHVLLEKVLLTTRDLEVRQDRFDIIKDRLIRAYKNSEFAPPYQQVGSYTRWLGDEKGFIRDQYLEELPSIQAEDVRNFKPMMLSQLHAEVLVHGNVHREDALKLTNKVEHIFKPRVLPRIDWPIRRSVILPRGSTYQYNRTLGDPSNVNHCIQYILQVGDVTDRARTARLRLFAKMTEEAAFNKLRTVEQLGYVVFSGFLTQGKIAAYHVLIQSERTPEYLDSRIENFLNNFQQTLSDMPQDTFDSFKRSLIASRLEKVKNLNQERSRFFTHISDEMYFFDEREDDVANIKLLTKQQMLDFYNEYISPAGQTRAKLAVHLIAQGSAKTPDLKPDEQSQRFSEQLGGFLSKAGVQVDSAKLTSQLAKVDLTKGNQGDILRAVSSYLQESGSVAADKMEGILDQGKAVLGSMLAGLGIKSEPEANGNGQVPTVNGNGHAVNGVNGHAPARKVTIIDDVRAFKASLPLTSGAAPVRDLSEYEDFEAKL